MKFYQYINENKSFDELSIEDLYKLILASPLRDKFLTIKMLNQNRDTEKVIELSLDNKEVNEYLFCSREIQLSSFHYFDNRDNELKVRIEEYYINKIDDQKFYFSWYNQESTKENIFNTLENILNSSIPYNRKNFLEQLKFGLGDKYIGWNSAILSLLTPKERKSILKNDVNIEKIKYIPNLTRPEIEYLITNKPWILTDEIVKNWPDDLKSKWSRVGKARKQIGL